MSRLLRARRGHDSEDEYSDSDQETQTTRSMGATTDLDEEEDESEDYTDSDEDEDNEEDDDEEKEVTNSEQGDDIVDEKGVDVVIKEELKPEPQVDEHTPTHDETTLTQEPTTTSDTATSPAVAVEEIDYEATKVEKRIQEHREYRRKLAEDPSFVPYLGLFWSHDDRYREDSFTEINNSRRSSDVQQQQQHQEDYQQQPYFNQQSSQQHSRANYDKSGDPLMYKKWDHSGYEELLRLDEQDEQRRRALLEARVTEEGTKRHHHSQRGGRGYRGGRGGYHHHGQRYNNFNNNNHHYRNKQPQQYHEKKEGWPELGSTGATTVESKNAWATVTPKALQEHDKAQPQQQLVDVKVDQIKPVATNTISLEPVSQPKSIVMTFSKSVEVSDDIPVASTSTIHAWGSVDREKEVLNVDKKDAEADQWAAASKAADGWSATNIAKTDDNDGWGAPKADEWADKFDWNNVTQDTIAPAEPTKTLENNKNETVKWTKSKSDDWNTSSAPKQDTTTTGWKSEPLAVTKTTPAPAETTEDDSWKQSASTDNWNNRSTIPTTTIDTDASWSTPAATVKPTSTKTTHVSPPQQNFNFENPNTKARDDWHSSKKVPDQFLDAESSSPIGNKAIKQIPSEEKAASSWAQLSENAEPEKPFMSDTQYRREHFSYRNNSHNRFENGSPLRKYQNNAAEGNWKQQNYHNKPVDQTQAQQEKAKEQEWNTSAESSGWATNTINEPAVDNGRGSTAVATESENNSGWGQSESAASDARKSNTTEKVTFNDFENVVAPADTTTIEQPATNKANNSWTTPATNITASAAAWGAEVSEDSETQQRQNGWFSNSHRQQQNGWSNSNSSSDWNADKRANNQRFNKDQQPRKIRGYLSQKMESTSITPSSLPVQHHVMVEPQEEEEIQVYIGGDEDSDVEIILDEEADWVKNEEILGMTAPRAEEEEYENATHTPVTANVSSTSQESPQFYNNNYYNNSRRSYDSSSPQPEMQQYGNYRGKNYNPNYRGGSNKPRRNYDDNWRQRDDTEQSTYYQHPRNQMPPAMYYPQPAVPGGQGQFYMIPANGIPPPPVQNGTTPMYAMPYHPGMSSSPNRNGSASPHSNHSGDHSPAHIHHHQQQPKFYAPPPLPPGYEANGMVYYGMDPSAAMYGPPQPLPGQPIYYYTTSAPTQAPIPVHAPPAAMFLNHNPHLHNNNSHQSGEEDEEGWGPAPDDVVEQEWPKK